MTRSMKLGAALIVAIGAAAFVYQMQPEPVPEPILGPHERPVEGPPPKVEVVGSKSHQFGTMIVGTKGAHTWEFKNLGEGPLDVWLEETTCSCTVASLKSAKGEASRKITIAPGQSAPIEVEWEGRKPGRFAQAASIGTSDPENRDITLSILGKVELPVEVRPTDSITLPDGSPEEAQRTTLSILSVDQPGMKLTKLATSKPGLIVAESRPIPAAELERLKVKSGYEVKVEIKPGMPTGRFSEEVLVETDHPGRPSFKVTLAGNIVGAIAVVPSRVQMPSVPSIAGASRDLALIVRGNRETRFEVASKPERVQVAISRENRPDAEGRYRLTVTVPPGTKPGMVDDPIVLKTDHPKLKEVRIPVSIYVSTRSDAG